MRPHQSRNDLTTELVPCWFRMSGMRDANAVGWQNDERPRPESGQHRCLSGSPADLVQPRDRRRLWHHRVPQSLCRTAARILAPDDFAHSLNPLDGLEPCEIIHILWTSPPEIFTVDPIQLPPGLNTGDVNDGRSLLTEARRFKPTAWSNVLTEMAPAFRIASGDTVVTETLDAAGTNARGERKADQPNPLNGPIFVAGAEPGDALRVDILKIDPASDTGWTRAALSANVLDPEYARHLPPRDRAEWIIDRKVLTVRPEKPAAVLKNLILPYAPMIGCFGVAPPGGQAISTATSSHNGGNMDYRGFTVGCSVSFPVSVPGALFFLGDCHASQGDGEIAGTGVETCCDVEVRLTVEKHRVIGWPRGETEDRIFTVGNARPLDQALQHATTEMVVWLKSDYGLSDSDAAHLLGQVVRYEVGNVFNPAYTMICSVARKWLPARLRAS